MRLLTASASRVAVSALLALVLAAGCARPPAPPPESKGPQAPVTPDQWVQYLTLEEKVGQMFWIGLPGTTVPAETEAMLRGAKAGGVILFGRQGSDPKGLRDLTGIMQTMVRERERFTPGLLISIDQEGGHVQRLGSPFTAWPGNMAIGATGSAAYAEQVARAMAREMLAAGVNTNLAPDADVNINPENPVIGIRSFGEDPAAVARLVNAAVKGFQAEQVSAVAKHFPGHGDTNLDSHKALPAIPHGMDRLSKVELVPFQSAMEAGVDAIMTAHIIFPAVATDGLPATLSPKVLQGLLRDKLGYQGVVVTDAMEMKAISDHYGVEKGLIMSIQAGADVVLVTESFAQQQSLHAAVVKAVNDGQIPLGRIDDAVRRITALKIKRGLVPGKSPPQAQTNVIGAEDHQQLALKVGADALTLVRNKHLPLKLKPDQQVLAVGPSYAARTSEGVKDVSALGAGIIPYHENVLEVATDRRPTQAQLDQIRSFAGQAAVIVYGVYNGHKYPEHQAVIKELVASGKPVIVVGMGEPYDLTKLPQIQTYIAAYGYQQPNLQGVGALLFGRAPAKGKLPVSIPDLYPIGHGLSL